jgi:hypothetical protein
MDENALGQRYHRVQATYLIYKIFLAFRWTKMPVESRLAVVDRTFDVMVQQTITNTTGYKMSKQALFLLCPEIAPEARG